MRLHFVPFLLILVWLSDVFARKFFRTEFSGKDTEAAVICGESAPGTIFKENDKYIVPLPGWGRYAFPITAAHDSAQFYFDQGLNMYYGYHMKEAVASFKESGRFDPASPMPFWGQALAMGPYYNSAHSYKVPDEIYAVLMAVNRNMGNASPREKRLIKAMNSRYPEETGAENLKARDEAYALEMRKLVQLLPDDPDIKMLYVDAIMLMHAWDFWNADGTAKDWTEEIAGLCVEVLKSHPDHPASLHYYIHLTEASRNPEVALANAGALEKLFPGVPHMVHMASHSYQRNGQYGNGVRVNDKADDNLIVYESAAKNLSLNKHSPHYFAVQTYCALTGAMYSEGMKSANRCRQSVSPTAANMYDQYLYMLPALTQVRLGKWKEILSDQDAPDRSWSYASLIHHFAKGMAFTNTGQADSASWHLSQLRQYHKDPVLAKRRIPFNAPAQMSDIAERILVASILFDEKKTSEAFKVLNDAITIEDQLIYTEPADWPLPARQFLGAFLLKTGKPELAEKVYQQDLMHSPGNGWSLLGLYQSAAAQGKKKEKAFYQTKYKTAFADADETPSGSVIIR